jgi:hypothetical protein
LASEENARWDSLGIEHKIDLALLSEKIFPDSLSKRPGAKAITYYVRRHGSRGLRYHMSMEHIIHQKKVGHDVKLTNGIAAPLYWFIGCIVFVYFFHIKHSK